MNNLLLLWHCCGSCEGSHKTVRYCSGHKEAFQPLGRPANTWTKWLSRSHCVSSESLIETQWLVSLWQLRVRLLSGPCEGVAFLSVERKDLTDLKKSENRECEWITISWSKALPSEANSSSASQEFRSISWNPDVVLPCLQEMPLLPMLSQMNSININFCPRRLIVILPSHVPLGLPNGIFHSGCPTEIWY
jgi:hypothetical protein